MSDKKSFVLYIDYWQHLELLSLEERGELLTAIYDYVRTGTLTEFDGSGLKMAFSFIRAQLDRDAEKYEAVCERNRTNGSKGGRPPKEEGKDNPEKPKKTKKPNGLSENPNNGVVQGY